MRNGRLITAESAAFLDHPVPTFLYEPETLGILAANRAATREYGYSAEELRALTIADLSASADGQGAEPERGPGSGRHRRKGGETFEAGLTTSVLESEDPPVGMLAVQPRLEDAALTERLMTAVWNHASDPMRITDEKGTVVRVNEAYCRFAGMPREALEHRPFSLIYPEGERDQALRRYVERVRGGDINAHAQHQVTLRDGLRFWLELTNIFVQREPAPLLLTIFRDITDQQVAHNRLTESRKALEESETQLKTLMSNLPGMAYRCNNDAEWTMLFISEGCHGLTGYYPADLIGNGRVSYASLVHPEDRERVWECVQDSLAEKRPFTLEYRILTAAGTTRWVWEQGCGIWSKAGDLIYLDGLIIDITKRRDLIAELEEARRKADAANATKTAFLANMSHEIRTPMNGILGLSELALSAMDARERNEYLALLKHSGEALMEVLNDILDLARLEAHRLAIEKTPFSLRDCISRSIDPVLATARNKKLALSCEVSEDLPAYVVGDPTRLRQILLNLVGNAIKFTAEGHVRIKVDSASGGIQFTVEDTGIGIAPSQQGLIFEPFQQADVSTTRKYGGSGLGLAITSDLVALMGGTIQLESEPGRGSRFQVELPLAATGVQPAPKAKEPARPARALAILLAEDNPVNQLVTSRILRREGHSVLVAGDGAAAVAARARQHFDVVLMDIHMPVMDGLEATAAIRRLDEQEGIQTPIIALTAHALAGDQENFLAAGIDAYVTKPVVSRELLAVISEVAGRAEQSARPDSRAG